MNLTLGAGNWSLIKPGQPWVAMPENRYDKNGTVLSLAADEQAALALTPPGQHPEGVTVRCTYEGTGDIVIDNYPNPLVRGDHYIETLWKNDFANPTILTLYLRSTNPADPVRNIDCREVGASKTQLFSDEFVASLRPFGVLRFMDWQATNANISGRWSDRTLPTSMLHLPDQGVAIEHMVELAREVNADPWFCIPYNADDEYITKFAQLVHDRLPADRKVYVELSNEVWNYAFSATDQARREGLAANLSSDQYVGALYRYTQKARHAMDIWKQVFADRPNQLVRVLATQSSNPFTAQVELEYEDVPSHFDALSTAPYFYGVNTDGSDPTTLDAYFTQMGYWIDQAMEVSRQNKALADRFHLRLIAYEAGQHVVINDVDLQKQIQRDPRMYDLYQRYIRGWYETQGDLINLYSSVGPISNFGAWGMREYVGQPLSETPKWRAALDAAAMYKTRPAN